MSHYARRKTGIQQEGRQTDTDSADSPVEILRQKTYPFKDISIFVSRKNQF